MAARRWAVLGFAFLAKNVAMSATYSCYGLMIPLLLQDFSSGTSRLSFGISLVSLVMGIAAPWVGRLLDRWSLSGTVVMGCLIAAGGFFLAARTHNVLPFVLIYGLIGGLGITAMGNLPSMKLAALSFPLSKGKAIGFAMLPVSGIAAPLLCAPILAAWGWRHLLDVFAAVFVTMALITPWVVKQLGHSAGPAAKAHSAANVALAAPLGRWGFLYLAVAAGMLISSGIVLVTHLVSYAGAIDVSAAQAAVMLAVSGGASIPGAYTFAWLTEKYPPAYAIAANAALQLVLWLVMAGAPSAEMLWIAAVALGFCVGGPYPSFTVFVSRVYSQHQFGSAAGRLAFAIVPFNFAMPPLIGWLSDRSGSQQAGYRNGWLLEAGLCAMVIFLMAMIQPRFARIGTAA